SSDDSCFRIDVIEEAVSEVFQDSMSNNLLKTNVVTEKKAEEDENKLEEQVNYLENNRKGITYEEIERTSTPNTKPSVEIPPTVELKPLPQNLEYAFIEKDSKLPVIILAELSTDQKERLLEVLRNHKGAIAWKLFDIKGINPSFCTYKILMEEGYHPVIQPQR